MNWLKNIFVKNKEIMPFHLLKEPEKIIVIMPINEYNVSSYIPILYEIKNKFNKTKFIGIVNEEEAHFFQKIFDEIISYDKVPKFLTKKFFRLRKNISKLSISISIDFNKKNDIFSIICNAHLRIGFISSPIINYKIKIPNDLPLELSAKKLVNMLCPVELKNI